ncbi:PilN domain-containing protein [Pseudotenacibaculum sp. MALMAid0570]|uniref:PilN domain-containing protein n=1 Tax=Pseudotenacibaculum sp. MALMAid0570 TaxID=3143938 RepID=UPI0032DEC950
MKQQITYGSQFCAVEHASNSIHYLLSLKKKKKELSVSQKGEFKEFNELLLKIKPQKHVFLIVNNEQVLTKKVDFSHIAQESVVKAAFPNIALNDFYFEVTQNGTSSVVCICRKEVVENIVKGYTQKGISVIHFSLGNSSFQNLLPYLNDFNFHTSNTLFEVRDHKIIQQQKSREASKTYDINGLVVDSNQMLPLAGILTYYSGIKSTAEDAYQYSLKKEYQQRRFFQLGIRFGLGFLFVSLLINFLVFSSYNTTTAELSSELALNETYKKQLLNLTSVVSKKKKLVESIQGVSNSKVLWYFDEIAKTVPKTLALKEVNYHPLARPGREGKPIVFTTNQIVVKGLSKDNQDLTNWLSELNELDWVEKVSAVNYERGKYSKTTFDFIIKMKSDTK